MDVLNNGLSLGNLFLLYSCISSFSYFFLEPWVGDHMADPTLLVPGQADHRTMEPLWNKGTDYIRTVDNTTLIFFEGSTYGTLKFLFSFLSHSNLSNRENFL